MKTGRPRNTSPGTKFEVTLAPQSVAVLKKLAKRGMYGRSPSEVGGRLLEQSLQQFVEAPKFGLDELSEAKDTDESSE